MFAGIKSVASALFLQKAPRRKSQRPRYSRSKQRSFETLEPRQLLSGNALLSIIPNPLSAGGYMLDASDLYSGRQITSMAFTNTTGTTTPIGTVNADGTQTAGGYISGNDWYQPLGSSYGTSEQDFEVSVKLSGGGTDTADLAVIPDAITQSQVSYNGTLANPSVELSVSGIVDWTGTTPYVTFYSGSGTSTKLQTVAVSADGSYDLSVPLSSSFTPATFTAAATDSSGSAVYSGETTSPLSIPGPVITSLTASSDDSTGSTLLQLTANGVYDTDASGNASVTSVAFYLNSTGNPALGVSDGANGSYSIDVSPTELAGSPTFYAVATDSMNQTATASLPLNSAVVGQYYAANNNRYIAGTAIDLTASGVMDGNAATISDVEFYLDNGSDNFGTATPLGPGTDASGTWTYPVPNSGSGGDEAWTGPQLIWVQATDSGGTLSAPVSFTVNSDIPTIDSVSASTDSSSGTTMLALTANGVNDNYGTISSVTFWEGATTTLLGGTNLGSTTCGCMNETLDVPTSSLNLTESDPYPYTFYAVVTNDLGQSNTTPPSVTINPIIVGQLTASSQVYVPSDDLTVTASGLLDLAGTPSSVVFYTVTPSGSTSIGTASSSTGGNWTSTSISTGGWSGPMTIEAIASDGTNSSAPVYMTIMPDTAPVITSLTAAVSVVVPPPAPPAPSVSQSSSSPPVIVDYYCVSSAEVDSIVYTWAGDKWDTQYGYLSAGTSGFDYKLYASDDTTLQEELTATSWSAFETSSEFNPIYWAQLEGSYMGDSPTAYFTALNSEGSGGGTSATIPLTLTANIAAGDNQVTGVTFYAGTPGSGTQTDLGTIIGGSNGWTMYVSPSAYSFSNPQEFYAVAIDSMGNTSSTSSPTTLSVSPVGVGTLSADSGDRYYSGHPTVLTASGLTDWVSGSSSVNEVKFYQDDSGTGDFANATYLTTVSTSSGSASYTFTPSGTVNGPQTFFAVAVDTSGILSAPVAITLSPDMGPSIDSVGISTTTSDLVLTANNAYSPDGTIASVKFYEDSGTSALETVTDGTDGYSWNVALSSLTAGPHTFYAVATDDLGDTFTSPTVTVDPVVIGQASAASDGSGLYIPGESLELSVNGLVDWNGSGAAATSVTFYQDTSDTGVYNSTMANNLGSAGVSSESATKTVSTTGWSGPQTIFAVAADGTGTNPNSEPVAIIVLPDPAPSVGGVSTSTSVGNVAQVSPGETVSPEGATIAVGGAVLNTTSDAPNAPVAGLSLDFTAATWNSSADMYDTPEQAVYLQVESNGAIDIQYDDADSGAPLHDDYVYPSWAEFKASSDFDPVYWSTIESSGGADAEGIIADLEQTNGRGVAYELIHGPSGSSDFLSALASYDSSTSGDTLTLTATDVYSPNGSVASVKFYAGTGTSYLLGTATYADDNGNWTIDVSPSSLGGATTVTIVVADSEGVTNGSSGTTFSISPVSLGQITVDTGDGSGPTTTPVYTSGTSVSISVASVLTTNSGATIAGVKFYLDTSGTGIYNPATVQLLTGSLASNGTGGYTLSGVNTNGWIGDQTIFVVAYDSTGAPSCPQQDQTVLLANPVQQPAAGNGDSGWYPGKHLLEFGNAAAKTFASWLGGVFAWARDNTNGLFQLGGKLIANFFVGITKFEFKGQNIGLNNQNIGQAAQNIMNGFLATIKGKNLTKAQLETMFRSDLKTTLKGQVRQLAVALAKAIGGQLTVDQIVSKIESSGVQVIDENGSAGIFWQFDW